MLERVGGLASSAMGGLTQGGLGGFASAAGSSAASAVGGLASSAARNQTMRTAALVSKSAVEQVLGLDSLTARLENQRAQLLSVTHALQVHSMLGKASGGSGGAISEYLVAIAAHAGLLKITVDVSTKRVEVGGGTPTSPVLIDWGGSAWPPERVGGWDVSLVEGRVLGDGGQVNLPSRKVLLPLARGLDSGETSLEWRPDPSDVVTVDSREKALQDICSSIHGYDIVVKARAGAIVEDPLPEGRATGIFLK